MFWELRICPYPKKPLLESFTNKPIICQLRGQQVVECARGSCEQQSGFCCVSTDDSEPPRVKIASTPRQPPHMPFVGEKCTRRMGCAGNAACVCEKHDKNCFCECIKEMGYMVDEETKTCKRTRRRLKEKCKSDMECQAAFSECMFLWALDSNLLGTSSGCRCKSGFQRNGSGGCVPTSHRCVNHAEPLKLDGHLVTCTTLKNQRSSALLMDAVGSISIVFLSLFLDATIMKDPKKKKSRQCPSSYYCVAVFDLPKKPNLYQVRKS